MTMEPKGSSPFYSYPELWEANEKKIGINTLRAWGRSKKLKTVRVGRKILVPKSELDRLVEIAGGDDL